jgi:beta-lactamase class D
VSEAQRQHGWFACLKTLPIYESRAARERISPCSVFKIQI